MRGLGLLLVGFLSWSGLAQAVVLWSVSNEASATMVPAYRGQPSPFPQPKKAEVDEAAAGDEAAQAAARLRAALTKARRLVASPKSLQLNPNQLSFKGVTEGAAGTRVLVQNTWVGMNEAITVRYAINPITAEALRELRALDAEAAATLQTKLNDRRRELEEQGVKIQKVNTKNKQIILETPQGRQQIPLVLVP